MFIRPAVISIKHDVFITFIIGLSIFKRTDVEVCINIFAVCFQSFNLLAFEAARINHYVVITLVFFLLTYVITDKHAVIKRIFAACCEEHGHC